MMLEGLKTLFDRIEQQRQDLLKQTEGLNEAQLAFQPGAGEWSLLEVLHHLTLVEQAMMRQASHPDVVARLAKQSKRRVPFSVVWLVLHSGIRVPVPSDKVLPAPGQPLSKLKTEWEEARRQMKCLLEVLSMQETDQPFAVHPVCGPLTPTQVLLFTQAHCQYHFRQMKRIRRAIPH